MATLRGVGGGKTRMIEEARIRMRLLYPNWLLIAITFNHKTYANANDFALKDADAIVAYAVCCRMMAAVYNTPIIDAQACLNTALNITESTNYAPNMLSFAENLIVGTVRHIAGRVRKVNPAIDSMVLFIDEPVKLIEGKRFPKDVFDDRYAFLRQTILGESVGKVLHTSLVMTAFNVSVFGVAEDSGRIVVPIELASTLPVDHIVDNMWIPFFHGSAPLLDAAERAMLKWLAASVSAAPRLVELMGTALQAEFADTWSGGSRGLTLRQSMGAVLSEFVELQNSWYLSVPFPVGKYLHALINDQAVSVDATMLQYVRSSTFTNSITRFPSARTQPVVVPESALCLLATATEVVSDDSIAKEIQKEFKAIWGSLLDHITAPAPAPAPESSPLVGQPLEDVFARVLGMKILSSHLKEGSSGQTTLMDLLAIEDMSAIKYTIGGAPYKAAQISNTGNSVMQDGVQKTFKQWEADTFEHAVTVPLSVKKKEFLSQLLNRKIIAPTMIDFKSLASSRWKEAIRSVDSRYVLTIPPLPDNDHHCDSMLFFSMLASTSGMTSPPKVGPDEVVLVFEEKSMSMGDNNESNEIWRGHFSQGQAGEKEKGPYDRHGKFCQAVAGITESDLEGDTAGYLRALQEGRFLYVYVTTHGGPTVYLTAEDVHGSPSNSVGVLVLNREVTKRILGPIYDVYALTRSASTHHHT